MLEVVEPIEHPVLYVSVCLLTGFREVHQPDQAPRFAVDSGSVVSRPLFHDIPVQSQHVEPGGRGRADRQQTVAIAAGQART